MMKKMLAIVVSIAMLPIFAVRSDVLIWSMTGGNPQREGLFTSMPTPPLSFLWKSDSGVRLSNTSSSILTDGQKIFITGNNAANGQFVCMDWQTGKVDWRADFGGKCLSSAVISNNKISVAATDGRIYGVSIDGKSAFSIKTGFAKASVADPLDTGVNLIYCLEDFGAGIFAVNPATNEKNWDLTRSSSNSIKSNPCANEGTIFACYNDDIVVAINENDHSIIWEKDLKERVTGGSMVVSGLLVIPTEHGLTALKTDNGEKAWSASTADGSQAVSNPATDGRLIFFNSLKNTNAVDSQTGNLVWSQTLENGIMNSSTPSVGSGMVCVHDGRVCQIFNCDTGEKITRFDIAPETVLNGQPLVLWDRILFASPSGMIYCWGLLGDQPEPQPPTDPNPKPEPPKENPVISTLKINAPEKGYLGKMIEIPIEISSAKNLVSGFFTFVFDSNKLEFVGVKPGEFLTSQNVPLEVKAEPVDLGAKITISITKSGGVTGDGVLAYIALKPKVTGVHNLTIIDGKMTDEKNNSHDPNVEPDSFIVEEETQPPPDPPVDPEPTPEVEYFFEPANVDLGIINSVQNLSFKLTQKNGSKASFVIRSSADYAIFYPTAGQLEPNSNQEIKVSINPSGLKPGDYELVISVNILEKTLKSSIKFKIPDANTQPPACIEILPTMLDFGFIPRGKEVSINFTIMVDSDEELSGTIESDKAWLAVTPVVFMTKAKRIQGVATISASELPGGESFEGHLSIKTKNNVCRQVTVLAKVQTQPSIVLEMDIGVQKASIAGFSVPLDSPPFIRNSRTLVPIRFVSEAFGCKVQWEASSRKITISRFNDSITLWVGQQQALVNGNPVTLDVAPSLENSITFVPIRFISEAFGANVEWFGETRHIRISYTPPADFTP